MEDMLKFPLDVTDLFLTSYKGYQEFPFDKHNFIYSFAMADFVLKGIEYRFDFYQSMFHPILWSPNVDTLPEFDIHYDTTRIETISDYTVYDDAGRNASVYHE
jgi:hypothetical protein